MAVLDRVGSAQSSAEVSAVVGALDVLGGMSRESLGAVAVDEVSAADVVLGYVDSSEECSSVRVSACVAMAFPHRK